MAKFKLFFVMLFLFLFFLIGICYGQPQQTAKTESEHEVNLWSRNTTVSPWYFYTGKFVLDARYNFDLDKTGAFCIGKSLGGEKFSIIPEACGYAGTYNGYGPELWILSETKSYSVTSYIQYAKFLDTDSFGYAWIQAERKIGRHVEFGLGGQALKNGANPFEADFGPAGSLKFGKFAINFVPLFRATKEERGKLTLYTGFSFAF